MSKAALVLLAIWVALAAGASPFHYPESLVNGWDGPCQNDETHLQSPINILTTGPGTPAQADKIGRYKYWQPSLGTTSDTILKNNGHGVELELVDRHIQFTSTSFPLTYAAAQLHFHTRSEHRIDGADFPLELHIVHLSANGGKAVVVGILFEEGDTEDPLLAQIVPFLPQVKDVGPGTESVEISFIPKIYIPSEFYEYEGGLTTPNADPAKSCAEIVHWMVATKPRTATAAQIAAFEAVMDGNARTPTGQNGVERNSINRLGVKKTKFVSGNPAINGPFEPSNSIHPTFVESIIPAGNRVLVELSQAQLQDNFGIHSSQIANLWTNPVGYVDQSGINAQTAVVVAIGPDAQQGAEWDEGATVIVDLEGCDSVGLNGLLYFLCDAGSIYGEVTVESWGANGAHSFVDHLSDNDEALWRHRTF